MTPKEFKKRARPVVLAHKNFNKIFGVGFNKTGTSSLEEVFRRYGYDTPDQIEQEIRLTLPCNSGCYDEFKSFVDRFHAFQDQPFSQGELYIVADILFPNSRFILTERDPEDWFESMCRFHKKFFGLETLEGLTEQDIIQSYNYLFPGYSHANIKRFLTTFEGDQELVRWDLLYNKDYYIKEYTERNIRIKKYFQNYPEKLLVIDVTKEEHTHKITQFLNIPDELVINMPHKNRSQ